MPPRSPVPEKAKIRIAGYLGFDRTEHSCEAYSCGKVRGAMPHYPTEIKNFMRLGSGWYSRMVTPRNAVRNPRDTESDLT